MIDMNQYLDHKLVKGNAHVGKSESWPHGTRPNSVFPDCHHRQASCGASMRRNPDRKNGDLPDPCQIILVEPSLSKDFQRFLATDETGSLIPQSKDSIVFFLLLLARRPWCRPADKSGLLRCKSLRKTCCHWQLRSTLGVQLRSCASEHGLRKPRRESGLLGLKSLRTCTRGPWCQLRSLGV